jgi:hypothetical protein
MTHAKEQPHHKAGKPYVTFKPQRRKERQEIGNIITENLLTE